MAFLAVQGAAHRGAEEIGLDTNDRAAGGNSSDDREAREVVKVLRQARGVRV